MSNSLGFCDGVSCCNHDPENLRYVMREDVLRAHCTQCHSEMDAPDDYIRFDIMPPVTAAPCGDEYPNRWGSPL